MAKLSTGNLAGVSGRHPWVTIGVWLLFLVLAAIISSSLLKGSLTTKDDFTTEVDSKRANTLLEKRLPGSDKINEIVVIKSSQLKVDDQAYQKFAGKLFGDVMNLGDKVVDGAIGYYQTGSPVMVSADRRATIMQLTMAGDEDDAKKNIGRVHKVIERADKDKRFSVSVVGRATVDKDLQEISEKDLRTGEAYGIGTALVVLVLVFGAVIAAGIPMVMAVAAIVAAVGLTALVGQTFELSFFVVNMISMMGLAVGIDYSLFIVSRYREERARGLEKIEAITTAGNTASRAVLFSGLTVILALLGMFLIPYTIFKSLAIGAVLVVVTAVQASLTLLPAVLGILGDKVNALSIPFFGRRSTTGDKDGGFWDWVSRSIMRRPLISLVLGVGILLAAIIPYFNINLGLNSGAGSLPDGLKSKRAFEVLENEFTVGLMSPVQVVIDGKVKSKAVQKGIERLQAKLATDKKFGPAAVVVNKKGNLALLNVPLSADATSDKAINAVEKLRDRYIPKAFKDVKAKVLVTGVTAQTTDFLKVTDDYTPYVFAFVLGLSFLLLTVVFRSLVVPIKAVIMNLLSVGAAYGLIVFVFQEGYGADFFGFKQVDKVEAWLPLFLFSILFGLSMDYHVFLLSRIREHFDQTMDNGESVAFGIKATGRIITGAALIMVVVFGGFASGELVMFQQMGFGLAVAVLLDATIVRSVLVPAGMKLLGANNWYLPTALQWLPDLSIEGGNGADGNEVEEFEREAVS